MTSRPADWYRWIPDQITAQEYEALPIEEYRLSEGRYRLVGLHTRRLSMDLPVALDIPFGELVTG
jgi:hypothetical protein